MKHLPGMPIRQYVRQCLAYGMEIGTVIEIYGIKVILEKTVNKTMHYYYTSDQYRELVKLGGHPSMFTPYHIKRNICTTYSTST